MKSIIILYLLILSISASGQDKYITKQGRAHFFSEAPLENIEALNKEVTSLIDFSKNEVVVSIPIKSFKFDKSLMEEHFNENYLESAKFPKATFQGIFKSTSVIDRTKDGIYPVLVEGKLTLHGVTNAIKTQGSIEVKSGNVIAKTAFKISIKEYNIDVPKLVIKNIAEIVDVTVDLPYTIQPK